MNLRPSGYEPDELPDCSTPRNRRTDVLGCASVLASICNRLLSAGEEKGFSCDGWVLCLAGLAATDSPKP